MRKSALWVHWNVASVALAVSAEPLGLPITFIGWLMPLCGALFILALRPSGWRFLAIWWPWVLYTAASVVMHAFANAGHRYLVLVTPLIVGAASSTMRLDQKLLEVLRRDLTLLTAVLCVAAAIVWRRASLDDVVLLAPHSILAVLLFWFHFVDYLSTKRRLSGALCLAVLLVPIMSRARTPLAVIALLAVFGISGIAVRKRVVLGSALAVALIVALFSGAFREKMLLDSGGPLSVDNIRTSGRSVAWAVLVERIPDQLTWGHGSNASEHYLAAISDHFSHPHNDWLRISFEYGLIGVSLFLLGVTGTVRLLWRQALRRRAAKGDPHAGIRRDLAAFALSMFGAMLALMVTDNVILYASFFGVLHFIVVGLLGGGRPHRIPVTTSVRRLEPNPS